MNAAIPEEQPGTLRECAQGGRPFGSAAWVETTAARLGLGFTLRGPGRPRKATEDQECPLLPALHGCGYGSGVLRYPCGMHHPSLPRSFVAPSANWSFAVHPRGSPSKTMPAAPISPAICSSRV